MNESVLKFGGSSVSSTRNILNVADVIIDYYLSNLGFGTNVVVSAIGVEPGGNKKDKTTDRLLAAANYAHHGSLQEALLEVEGVKGRHYSIITDLTIKGTHIEQNLIDGAFATLEDIARNSVASADRGADVNVGQLKDAMAGLGELLSTPIVAEVVQRKLERKFNELEGELRHSHLDERQRAIYGHLKSCNGQYTAVVDSRDHGFITNSEFTDARLLGSSLDTEIARHHLSLRARNKNKILFYPGFVGKDEYGSTTTLGRDGSNVTSVALAASINSREIVIYTDTDGELIIDPRIIGQAQTARYLSYKESSLSSQWGGMQVLKGDSLYILDAKKVNIPIRVKNSFNPKDPGTLITHMSASSNSSMKGVSVINDITYLEFPLDRREHTDRIEDAINGYSGARVLISLRENRNGQVVARFVVKTDPTKAEKDTGYYLSGLNDKIRQEVFGGNKLPEPHFKLSDASLITVCGVGLHKSYTDISRIENIVAGLPVPDGLKNAIYHLPVLTGENLIQLVVRRKNLQEAASSIYNQLKKVNIVLYGLGNVGSEFLRRAAEQYDALGLNVVGVGDSSGIYANPGGFSVSELRKIIELKSGGISTEKMSVAEGGVHLSKREGNLASVYEMGKGDFISVDATSDPGMIDTLIQALEAGSRVISVNKLPYAIQPKKYEGGVLNLERLADEKARKLYRAMMEQRLFNRGTVGANLGVPGTLMNLLSRNPDYVTAVGCMSGTLGHTCSALDKGMSLSEAVQSAVSQGIAESTPFTDYSGMDVLNKTLILWRTIATKYGLGFFDCDINYERFIDPAKERYARKTGKSFETKELEILKGNEFVERMRILDESFAELRAEAGPDKVFRYVGEIGYDSKTRRYSLDVRLKTVHKESILGSLDGTENMFLFGIDGQPKKAYGIEPGPGAGVPETADAIMNDLLQINRLARGESKPTSIQTRKYRPVARRHQLSPIYSRLERHVAMPQIT